MGANSSQSDEFVHEKIAPRKRFSQNFLVNEKAVQDIVESLGPVKSGTILECGVGKGALTGPLAKKYPKVPIVGVDIDRDCLAAAEQALKGFDNVTLLNVDLCGDEFFQLIKQLKSPITFIGNLPYHISSQVLLRLIQTWPQTSKMVFMFQKEFAERLRAHPAEEAFGKLSVLFQCFYEIRKAISLSPGSFYPRPTVNSEVLVFTPLKDPVVPYERMIQLTKFLGLAFMHRRKTLRYNLKRVLRPRHLDYIKNVLAKEGITLDHRAEIVPVNLWGAISEVITK